MSEKNITEMVNINGESEVNSGRCKMEKTRSDPCTVTLISKLNGQAILTKRPTSFQGANNKEMRDL